MIRKKILIMAPINDYGGINLDVGFIANLLEEKHDLNVISLGNYFKDSQVYYFNKNLNYNSLNRIIYQSNLFYKIIIRIVCYFKPISIPNHFRVSDILKRIPFINAKRTQYRFLKKEIIKADFILICSQLTASLNKEIMEIAFELNKPVIFKTTGHINSNNISTPFINLLKKVTVFINHSKSNSTQLKTILPTANNIIIDQNAYLERELLDLPPKNLGVKHFFTLSRLHSIKKIDLVIKTFLKMNSPNFFLNIYGNGMDLPQLKKLANNNPNIRFHGSINYNDLDDVFKNNDCLIISSRLEAGPYTAIESMAAATPIISTRVGAMEERLSKNYPYFFNGSISDLEKKIIEMTSLSNAQHENLSKELREIYLKNYSSKVIRQKYYDTFNTIIQ